MKLTTVILALILGAASSALATQWTCEATGEMNLGPGGAEPMTVTGQAADNQLDAMSNAQSACLDQGLNQCTVQNCWQR